jgi:hypothetical protein
MKRLRKVVRFVKVVAGIPGEIKRRIEDRGWLLDETVVYRDPAGWTLTAEKGMSYDEFTLAPNLQQLNGKPSRASAIHDKGWTTGKKDDGSVLTFDENNRAFRAILDQEDHREEIKDIYEWAVGLWFMRWRWRLQFGHE